MVEFAPCEAKPIRQTLRSLQKLAVRQQAGEATTFMRLDGGASWLMLMHDD